MKQEELLPPDLQSRLSDLANRVGAKPEVIVTLAIKCYLETVEKINALPLPTKTVSHADFSYQVHHRN